MDFKQVDQQQKEAIRTRMLMHDHVLKQQIKELHRVYQVQNKLTAELEKDRQQNPPAGSMTDNQASCSTSQDQPNPHFGFISQEMIRGLPLTIDYFALNDNAHYPNNNNNLDRPSASTSSNLMEMDGDHHDPNNGGANVDLSLNLGFGDGSGTSSSSSSMQQ